MKKLKYILLGVLAAFSLVFSACGGTEDPDVGGGLPQQSQSSTDSSASTGGDSSTGGGDSSTEIPDSSGGGDSSNEDVYAPNV